MDAGRQYERWNQIGHQMYMFVHPFSMSVVLFTRMGTAKLASDSLGHSHS